MSGKTTLIMIAILIISVFLSGCNEPANNPPTVNCFADETNGFIPLTVRFTSNCNDSDGTIKSYQWNFGDGSTSNLKNPTHTYTTVGTFNVKLTVEDDKGSTAIDEIIIYTAKANYPPTAKTYATPTTGYSPLTVDFTGNGADTDGYIKSYYWIFGDGTISNQQNPTHTYKLKGTYTAKLEVKDNNNAPAYDSIIITVKEKKAPSATLNANPTTGNAPLAVLFTGLGTDPDGTIETYYWIFGDGTISNQQNPTHTYTNSGTYIATLKVTDNDGLTDTDSKTITVTEPQNNPPYANAGGPYTSTAGQLETLSASGSYDSDGTITGYRWDYTNDGTYDTGWLTSYTTTYTYNTAGTYTIKLEVKDNDGATDTDTTTVTVNVKNSPPKADAGGPYTTTSGESKTFSASGSYDSDGTIIGYKWDYTNDGTWDTSWETTATTTKTYNTAGTYTIKLQVKDDDGAADTDTASITVDEEITIPNDIHYSHQKNCSDFSNLAHITYDGTYYYVIDISTKRVYKLDSNLQWTTGLSWDYTSNDDHWEGFDLPRGITYLNGFIYITGYDNEWFQDNYEIHKLDTNLAWKGYTNIDNYVDNCLEIDNDGTNLYVCDDDYDVIVFSPNFSYIKTISTSPFDIHNFAIHDSGNWFFVHDISIGKIYCCYIDGTYTQFFDDIPNYYDIDLFEDTLIAVKGGKTVYYYNVIY